jgi:hypothetical protein
MSTVKGDKELLKEKIEFGIYITLLEENLRLTPTERLEQLVQMVQFSEELKQAKARKNINIK